MGFITNVSISNDFWHQIAKDPEKLVEGISYGMNYGTNSPLGDAIDAERGRDSWWEHRQNVPQGVTVHHARHMDESQVIVNTYGSHPVNAMEVPSAIRHGWLDLNVYNAVHAERMAETLEYAAEAIRDALKAADKAAKLRAEDDRFRDAEHRDESLETDDGVDE